MGVSGLVRGRAKPQYDGLGVRVGDTSHGARGGTHRVVVASRPLHHAKAQLGSPAEVHLLVSKPGPVHPVTGEEEIGSGEAVLGAGEAVLCLHQPFHVPYEEEVAVRGQAEAADPIGAE